MKNKKILLLLTLPLFLVGCNGTGSSNPSSGSSATSEATTSLPDSSSSTSATSEGEPIEPDTYITIAQAKTLIPNDYDETSDKYYITATIKEIEDDFNGHMVIEDETGSLSIYYSHSEDGAYRYGELLVKPEVGEEVTFYGTLKNFKGTYEMEDAYMIGWNYELPEDLTPYTQMSIADARLAEQDELVRVSGEVIAFTYNISLSKTGFMLADNESSIYVYSSAAAKNVEVGETVDLIGQKDFYGASSNAKYGGSNQIANAGVVSHEESTSPITLPTQDIAMKELKEKALSEDITGKLFKVKAYITSVTQGVEADRYTNYYINDLSGTESGRVYSQASGSDFKWLDEYVTNVAVEEGQEIDYNYVTVYVTPLNASVSGFSGEWRYLPVKVEANADVKMEGEAAATFVYDSFIKDQFVETYVADPNEEMVTSYTNADLVDGEVTIEYASSNTSVATFTTENEVTTMNIVGQGDTEITVTIDVGGETFTRKINISSIDVDALDTLTTKQAVEAEKESEIMVRGIVGPSTMNQPGFYLFDEQGVIAIRMKDYAYMDSLSIGDEVIIQGTRTLWGNETAQRQIVVGNSELLYNLYGEHDYQELAKNYTITDKTLQELYDMDSTDTDTYTAMNIYQVTCKIEVSGSYGNAKLIDDQGGEFNIYSGNASQTEWLKEFADGNNYTFEFALVNWNGKNYFRGCILSVTDSHGDITYNTYNFN